MNRSEADAWKQGITRIKICLLRQINAGPNVRGGIGRGDMGDMVEWMQGYCMGVSPRLLGWVQGDFLEMMLPVIGDSIRQAEQQGEGHADTAGGPLDPSIAKALRRRQRGISSKKDLTEASTVFKVKATCILNLLACTGQAVCR